MEDKRYEKVINPLEKMLEEAMKRWSKRYLDLMWSALVNGDDSLNLTAPIHELKVNKWHYAAGRNASV